MNVDTMTPTERLALWDTHDRPERWNSGNEHHLADLIIRDLRGLSTPPADDVREALAREVADGGEPFGDDYRAADDILRRFEVRPHGTVTEAEVERALDALAKDYVILTADQVRGALEAARYASNHGSL